MQKKSLFSVGIMLVLTAVLILGSESLYDLLGSLGGKTEAVQTSGVGFSDGEVFVSTTILKDGTIADVKIIDASSQTDTIGQAAAPEMARRITEEQSLDVDAVTGATITCNAIKDAVAEALRKSGFDSNAQETETDETEMSEAETERKAGEARTTVSEMQTEKNKKKLNA